jgi:kinesin family protein 4/21/27
MNVSHDGSLVRFGKEQKFKSEQTVLSLQVQIGNFSFTFDYVYGSTATPSSKLFEESVVPLVDGLFSGYNATVLAYGQV